MAVSRTFLKGQYVSPLPSLYLCLSCSAAWNVAATMVNRDVDLNSW